MTKSILISIKPEWCRLIASGRKIVEVRKNRPKLKTPFKVYIYCTKGKDKLIDVMHDGDEFYDNVYHGDPVFIKTFPESFYMKNWDKGNGKIIGEFIVDDVYEIISEKVKESEPYSLCDLQALVGSCLTKKQIQKYLGDKRGFGWHISDLAIYDKPKELADFGKTRPPQSWCYVEEIK